MPLYVMIYKGRNIATELDSEHIRGKTNKTMMKANKQGKENRNLQRERQELLKGDLVSINKVMILPRHSLVTTMFWRNGSEKRKEILKLRHYFRLICRTKSSVLKNSYVFSLDAIGA
ncbi:unnamed protein product [Schistosoma mansoni]|uniref:Smp_205000 n=1 Tax=Schistosoma mansoni TaxID=6183 RepID=G4M118_SCHMA|nr:unnamed protein product [Schistosoma mansoni]|eukprot:XP_018647183.1 unnamed protein product [Schistosoma mansoni]